MSGKNIKEGRRSYGRMPYISDPKLIPRVQQYLAESEDPEHWDVDVIADHLQHTYREYRIKKRLPFRISVQKAYSEICKLLPSSSESEEEEAAITSDEDQKFENHLNNSLTDLYKTLSTVVNASLPSGAVIDRVGDKLHKTDNMNTVNGSTADTGNKKASSAKTSGSSKKRNRSVEVEGEAKAVPKKKKKKHQVVVQHSTQTFKDVGGNEKCIEEVCKLLIHLRHPEVYQKLGITPPRGFLLHGPPGCGKTLLAHAIAGELDLPLLKIAATEVVSGISGESEEKIRELFEQAVTTAPCILFIDEIDAITPKRETATREMERRIVAQLLACMDDLSQQDGGVQVMVIGATNRPDSLDPALRRAGRFDREICMGIPDMESRTRILKVLCRSLRLTDGFDFGAVASLTPGYVGADLLALTREAAMVAVNRILGDLTPCDDTTSKNPSEGTSRTHTVSENPLQLFSTFPEHGETPTSLETLLSWLRGAQLVSPEALDKLHIQQRDFKAAVDVVQPSAKREGFATIPDVTWTDVGALDSVKRELQLAILAPVRHPVEFNSLGLSTSAGILLYGPPGCGKTLLAKAVANEAGINFISVKGPELLNMYVGESERAVRQCFQRAKNSAPCVIFFDELDALCPRRSDNSESGSSARVVNQLLTEMDGMEVRRGVFLMAATNRPDILDPAVLRPGRLDKLLFVGLPSPQDQLYILRAITKVGKRPLLSEDVSMKRIIGDPRCLHYTGADLAALVREASLSALQEHISGASGHISTLTVSYRHFDDAFSKVRVSVSSQERRRYEALRISLSGLTDPAPR